MEITIDRQYLQGKIDLLKGITKHKTLFPATRSVLFELGGKDGKLSATDLEVSAVTGLADLGGDNGGKILVHAGTLSEVLENLADREVRLISGDPDNMLRIEQGQVEIGLALTDPREFPEIQVLNDTEAFQIAAKDILRGISKVLYAVSIDEERYILTGVLMQVKAGEFRMCATDGFRMALLKKEVKDTDDTPQIVIPGRNLKFLRDVLDENAMVGIIINEARVQLMTTQATVIFRTLQDKYPDYESILTATGEYNIAFAKRMTFLECLWRMAPLATKANWVSLARIGNKNSVMVRIESDKGYAQEVIDCAFKNKTPFAFSFNLRQLLDAIEHIDNEQLVIRYPEAYGVVVFDAVDYICGIMPIRTEKTPIEKQIDVMHGDRDE